MAALHVAQLNIGRLHHPLDADETAEFTATLDPVDALAEATPAQQLFEHQGCFGSGWIRRWYHPNSTDPTDRGSQFLGAGEFGTGANWRCGTTISNVSVVLTRHSTSARRPGGDGLNAMLRCSTTSELSSTSRVPSFAAITAGNSTSSRRRSRAPAAS